MTLLTLDPGIAQNLAIGILAVGAIGVVVLIALDYKRAKAEAAAANQPNVEETVLADETAADASEPEAETTVEAVEDVEQETSVEDVEDGPADEDVEAIENEVVPEADDTPAADEDAAGDVVEDVETTAIVADETLDSSSDEEADSDVEVETAAEEQAEDTDDDEALAALEEHEESVTAPEPVTDEVDPEAEALAAAVAAAEVDDLFVAPQQDDEEFVSAFGAADSEFALAEAVNEEDEKPTFTATVFEDEDEIGAAAVVAAASAVAAVAAANTDENDLDAEAAALADEALADESDPVAAVEAAREHVAEEAEAAALDETETAADLVPDEDAVLIETAPNVLSYATGTAADTGWAWLFPAGSPRTVRNVTVEDRDGVALVVFNPDNNPAAFVHAAYLGGKLPSLIVFSKKDAPADAAFEDAYGVKGRPDIAALVLTDDVKGYLLENRADGFLLDGGFLFALAGESGPAGDHLVNVALLLPETVRADYDLVAVPAPDVEAAAAVLLPELAE